MLTISWTLCATYTLRRDGELWSQDRTMVESVLAYKL